MQTVKQHPTSEELTDFIAGKLDAAQSSVIEAHLDACDACCQQLKHLPDDTLIGLLQADADTSVAPIASDLFGRHVGVPATSIAVPAELREHPRYNVQQLLGRGGMGVVYRAHHRLMDRPVAIKLIDAKLVQDRATQERFHREMQTAARLAHPNIVTAYDAEQAGEAVFLVMEFVDGIDLEQLVQQRGPLPLAEAWDYIRQAAAGLQYAHEQGMVHRDIKPHNLMLSTAGEVKILDFGLAHFASGASDDLDVNRSLTSSGVTMGTPDYIAPEQIDDSHAADIRADIYSLGCTFYQLLAGQPPFSGSLLKKIKAHAEQNAPPLAGYRDDVPPAVETVIRKMMAKQPGDRFQQPGEVIEALQRCASKVVKKPRTSTAPVRSRIAIGAALLLAIVGIVVTAIVLTVQTPYGEITIEVDSEAGDDVSVVARGNGHFEVASAANGWKLSLVEGEYQLETQGGDDQFDLDKQIARVTRGGKEIVRLTRKLPEPIPSRGDYALAFRGGQRVELPLKYQGGPITIEATASAADFHGGDMVSAVSRNHNSGIGLGTNHDGKWSANVVDHAELSPPDSYRQAYADDRKETRRQYHLALVFDGRQLKLFVDGRCQKTIATVRKEPRASDVPFFIGCNGDRTWKIWGDVDEVRISGVARYIDNYTPQARLKTDEDTLALYHFDEGAGDVLHDSSRHRRHGKIHGAKWIRTEEVGGEKSASIIQLADWIENGTDVIDGFAMSPDGRFIVNSNWASTVRAWDFSDLHDAKRVFELVDRPVHGHMRPTAISPDGHYIVVHGGEVADKAIGKKTPFLDLLDFKSGETVRRFDGLPAQAGMAMFTPDGKFLMTTSAMTSWGPVVQWDVATGKKVREFDLPAGDYVQRVVVSPDGRYFAIHFDRSRGDAPDISIWNLPTGKIAHRLPHKGAISIDFFPDGKQVITHSPTDGQLRIWNLETGEQTHEAPLAVSGNLFVLPDTRTALVVANHEQPGSILHLVDLEMGQVLDRVESDKHIAQYVGITPDGRHAITCGGWYWDSGTKQHLKEDDFQFYLWRLPERVWRKNAAEAEVRDDTPDDESSDKKSAGKAEETDAESDDQIAPLSDS